MAQQREATTDRLVGVIARIKMERRSGQLTVRRGEGLTSEEGTLIFVQGQVTLASVGRRNGSDALNWLSTWGQARYMFTPIISDEELPIEFSSLSSSSLNRTATSPGHAAVRVDTDRLEPAPADTDRLEPAHPLTQIYEVPHITVELTEATASIDRAGLSRSHRRLYLLIDGHRSIIDLVPLVGKKAEEVRNMLHDLEWLGVIRIVNPPNVEL